MGVHLPAADPADILQGWGILFFNAARITDSDDWVC